MKIVALVLWLFSGSLFYLVFFKLAPYIADLLPKNDWLPILKILVYLIVGYLGGIGLPVAIFLIGLHFFLNKGGNK